MRIYTCAPDWEAILTTVYEAWVSQIPMSETKIMREPVLQYSFLDEYIHVDADVVKAEKVMDVINTRISQHFYYEMAYTSMSYEEDVLDVIYHLIRLGFAKGPSALEMVQYRDVMRYKEIRKHLGSEVCHFIEFSRFNEIHFGNTSFYVSHIEPRSHVVTAVASHFEDRMPSENWMMIDDTHMEAAVHVKDTHFYRRILTEEEYNTLVKTENSTDEYTDLWKIFFDTIAIRERFNPTCQRNHIPIWTRKHTVEFVK